MKDSIGIFGGTFDPIHIGHINLACEVLKKTSFIQKILFMPAYLSPFKVNKPPKADVKDRLKMIALAIKPLGDRADLWDKEIKKEKISYTIDSLRELKKEYSKMFLILGATVASSFHLWKDYEEILALAPPIVAESKPFALFEPMPTMPAFCKKKLEEHLIKIPSLEISSTSLRKEYLEKSLFTPLIPSKVLDYIHKHHLYLESSRR